MIDFTSEQLDRYLQDEPGSRVAMLNLLRFNPDGGRERYLEYAAAIDGVAKRYGAAPLYVGFGGQALVADQGQEWDAVAIVSYPSRQAFAEMIADPEYQAVAHLRTEALLDATLQPTAPMIG
jgi:uncharacterized protein (DUF1330 family)